ncbi:hypothetical protein CU098_004367 [Rhizopus stolonifer]|uniref:Uncharacterized protein n=1 Tax=Rhizopus stolonifer TaxID=4846 RepID=A0A367KEH8_RHIST|nr:hypothetical protein CU098_004367 [Rhizopus stolonifer]
MWFLYKIEKNFNYVSKSYMRLRPGAQTALVPGTRHQGGVHENASFKPMLKLLVQDLDVRVDNTSVEQETYLHDQQIIHLVDSDVQYK